MTLFIDPAFAAPDRADQRVNHERDADGILDIGWSEGVMRDGRPIRIEMWAQDQISILTVFFSRSGLDMLDGPSAAKMLEDEAMVAWKAGYHPSATVKAFEDPSGNALWSVSIIVGDEEDTRLTKSPPIFRLAPGETPATRFCR